MTYAPLTFLCLGLNYRTAPVAVRERFSVSKSHLRQALDELRGLDAIRECVLLSTCNRTEVYMWTAEPDRAVASVLAHFLGSQSGQGGTASGQGEVVSRQGETVSGQGGDTCFYRHEGTQALTHLARVASGMDSMVIGETEIFGQLKEAYRVALEAGTTGGAGNPTFQHVFTIGKKVRSSTQITSGPTSVGAAAVQLAQDILGSLEGTRVLVVGAGDVARSTAQSLRSRGAEHIFVANRSYDRATELASRVGGKVIRFSEWVPYLEQIDIVIVSTASPVYVVNPAVLESVQATRAGKPLFFIDLSVPRNVNPACGNVPGIHVYDMDAMQAMAEHSLSVRAAEIERAQQMIADWVSENADLLLSDRASRAAQAMH